LEEGYGLDSGDLEALAAADVFACDHVVAAHHIGLGLGEAGAVALVGMAGQGVLFAADEPAELILVGLAAVGAGEGVVALLGTLVKKITFFHRIPLFCSRIDCKDSERGREAMAKKRAKKKVFSAVKAVKANARERVGQPKPGRVIEEKRRSARREEKHKPTLGERLNPGE